MENRCAIITGGTSGIGKAIALELDKKGYHIIATYVMDLKEEELKNIENEFNNISLIKSNVVEYEGCLSLMKEIKDLNLSIDILVNNAGITKDNLIMRMSPEDFKDVIDVNLIGAFNMIKVVSKVMIKQKYGRILNMASVIGISGNIGQANYAASKGGLIALSKSAARELASRNITVNSIAPGYIMTNMTAVLDEAIKEDIQSKIPLNRLGSVEDVVNAAMFLVDEKTSYITGQTLNVCGGMVM
ncbi:MAG: 3-oxoacyl-[acyl-carrier-protein] reductase [Erysipelotrichales bacterium]